MSSSRLSGRRLLDLLAGSTGRFADLLYCSLVHRLSGSQPFFNSGWGDLGVVDFNEDAKAFEHWPPAHFDTKIQWKKIDEGRQKNGTAYELLEGVFRTPCKDRVYDALPEESRTGRVQLLVPQHSPAAHACILHLAATGDQTFRSRVSLGEPLLSQGIATMVLESPFYGRRAPAVQRGSRLQRVSDLLTLGRSTIEESLCLLNWASLQGFTRLGMSGFSMGGVHACMVASLYPFPIACTPLLAPRSAAVAYCQGALHQATAWRSLLQDQDEKQRDITSTIWAAAQPNLVTAAALRVLQNPRLHTTPALLKKPQEETSGSASQPSDPQSPPAAQIHANSTSSQRWQTKDRPTEHSDSGQVTASSIGRHSGTSVPQHEASSPQGQAVQRQDDSSHGVVESSSQGTGSLTEASEHRKAWGLRWPKVRLTKLHGVSASQAARGQKQWLGIKGFGIDTAERMLRNLLNDKHKLEKETARLRLEQVLETYTDVSRFPVPQAPSAAVVVGALEDQYVLPHSVVELAEHWPGCEVRWVRGGHVTAFVLQQNEFRRAISDSIARLPA